MVRYHEQLRLIPALLTVVLLLLELVFLGTFVAIVVRQDTPVVFIVANILAVGLLPFVWWNFRHLTIRIDADHLEVGFGLWRQVIRFADIVAVEPEHRSAASFVHSGVQKTKNGDVAYLVPTNTSVRITLGQQHGDLVLSTKDPALMQDMLGRQRPAT